MPDMMSFTPGQGPAAAGEHAAAVADGQGAALGGADHPGGPADIQGSGGGAAQDRGQLGQHGPQQSLQAGGRGVVEVVAGAALTGLQGLAGDGPPGGGGGTGPP